VQATGSLRIALVVILVILFFAVVVFFLVILILFLIWFVSKEEIGDKVMRGFGGGVFRTRSGHVQWYASKPD